LDVYENYIKDNNIDVKGPPPKRVTKKKPKNTGKRPTTFLHDHTDKKMVLKNTTFTFGKTKLFISLNVLFVIACCCQRKIK